MSRHVVGVAVDPTPQHFTPDGTEAPWYWQCSCGARGNAQHVFTEGAEHDGQAHLADLTRLYGAPFGGEHR